MVKNYKNYIEDLQSMYPDIERESIIKIVKKGMSNLQSLIHRDHDVRLESNNANFDKYRIIFYRSQRTAESKKERYFINKLRLNNLRESKKEQYAKKYKRE